MAESKLLDEFSEFCKKYGGKVEIAGNHIACEYVRGREVDFTELRDIVAKISREINKVEGVGFPRSFSINLIGRTASETKAAPEGIEIKVESWSRYHIPELIILTHLVMDDPEHVSAVMRDIVANGIEYGRMRKLLTEPEEYREW